MNFLFKVILALLVSAGLLSAGAVMADTPRPEIAKEVKAYEGPEGLKVWALRIGPRSAKEMIVQLGGIDHELDMRIIKVAVEEGTQGQRYVMPLNGQRFVLLNLQNGVGELYLPGETHPKPIHYSESLSAQGNAEHFLTDYLNQSTKSR